jgi:hypothetical protein
MTGNSGFAIPINDIKVILNDLKSGKTIKRGFLGVGVIDKQGKIVLDPSPGGPSDQANVKSGDVLKKANGRAYSDALEFVDYVSRLKPGVKLNLEIERDGKTVNVNVVLGERPADKTSFTATSKVFKFGDDQGKRSFTTSIFLVNSDISQVANVIGATYGKNVTVTDPEKIKKNISLQIEGSTVEEALDVTCKAFDCTYSKDGDDYVIKPK